MVQSSALDCKMSTVPRARRHIWSFEPGHRCDAFAVMGPFSSALPDNHSSISHQRLNVGGKTTATAKEVVEKRYWMTICYLDLSVEEPAALRGWEMLAERLTA